MNNAPGDQYCKFDDDTLRCARCGYQAKKMPTFRVCKTVVEMAREAVESKTTRRIRVPPIRLGEMATQVLSSVGITKERVSKVLGRDCGCGQRAASLDYLGAAVSKAVENAANYAINAAIPSTGVEEDVAAMANAIAESQWVNEGLREAAAKSTVREAGNP